MNIQTESNLESRLSEPLSHVERNPRILALAHSTNLAGAQLALASLVKNTSEQLDWTVVCPSDGPFVEKIEPYADALITERYPWWCKGQAYSAPPIPFEVGKLNNVLNGIDYDIALTNTITVPWLAYNAHKRNLPHMWYIHEYGDLDHNLIFPMGYDPSIDYIRRLSNTVLTVSSSVGEHLLAHGASQDSLRYISQSFDVDAYTGIESPTDENELLIIGSIKESKGQLDALVGFDGSRIKESHSLTIAGPVTDARYADDIKRYIDTHGLRDKVNFIPERVDAVEQMKAASTVLVCSRNEALGRVTLEALAAGRVVIGSRGGGTEMLLGDSRGLLYDGTVPDLIRQLDGLEVSSDGLQAPAARRQYVLDNFSPDNERNDFLEAAQDALRRHGEDFSLTRRDLGKTGIMRALREFAIIA